MGNCLCCKQVGGNNNTQDEDKEKEALTWLLENKVIESKDDVFKIDFSDGSMPPLHSQSRKGNADAVERLLMLDKAKTTTKIVYGSRTPLHQAAAAKKGRLKTCKILLEFDAGQIEATTNDGSTPMHMLAQSDDDQVAVFKLFAEKGGLELAKKAKKDGSTLLHLACEAGSTELAGEVLKVVPSLALMVDGSVRTCLHFAAEKGHVELVRQLCKVHGMKYDTKDRNGSTCLALAAVGGHAEVVGLLVEQDSTLLNIRDRDGKKPFDLCAEFGTTKGHWVSFFSGVSGACSCLVPLISKIAASS